MNGNSFSCTRALSRQFFPNWSRPAGNHRLPSFRPSRE